MTSRFEISSGESIDLSNIDLSEEEDQELKDVLSLVDQESSCVSQFPFVSIEEQTGLKNVNGILGLGPNDTDNKSFLKALKTSGKIDKALVSFSLADKDDEEHESMALIGGVDLAQVVDEKLYTYPIMSPSYWSLDFKSLKYGQADVPAITLNQTISNYTSYRAIALVDTGSSFISLPGHLYDGLLLSMLSQIKKEQQKLDQQNKTAQQNGTKIPHVECASSGICLSFSNCSAITKYLSPMTIQLGDQAYELSPKSYMVKGEVMSPQLSGYCILGI